MDAPVTPPEGYKDAVMLCKKERMNNGKRPYAFRDSVLACEQKRAYVVPS